MTVQDSQPAPRTIGFRRPPRIPLGPALAIAFAGGLCFWMASGSAPDAHAPLPRPESDAPKAQIVQTIRSQSAPTSRLITAKGDTRALRRGHLSARRSAIVSDIHVAKGDTVVKGDPIVTLRVPDFEARATEAAAQLTEARRILENTEALREKGLSTQDALTSARSTVASAEARWAAIEEERADLVISAPFAGHINALDIELGDNIASGASVGEILDLSNILVDASVSQQDINEISVGDRVTVNFATGETRAGVITFISAAARTSTRSFPIEVRIDNPDGAIKAGVSADIMIEGASVQTHSVPSAFLSLSDDGTLVVKTVVDGHVKEIPVRIVASDAKSMKVSGLPRSVEIITVGQGFVRDGDAVSAGGAK